MNRSYRLVYGFGASLCIIQRRNSDIRSALSIDSCLCSSIIYRWLMSWREECERKSWFYLRISYSRRVARLPAFKYCTPTLSISYTIPRVNRHVVLYFEVMLRDNKQSWLDLRAKLREKNYRYNWQIFKEYEIMDVKCWIIQSSMII